jgi:hypothetical protein
LLFQPFFPVSHAFYSVVWWHHHYWNIPRPFTWCIPEHSIWYTEWLGSVAYIVCILIHMFIMDAAGEWVHVQITCQAEGMQFIIKFCMLPRIWLCKSLWSYHGLCSRLCFYCSVSNNTQLLQSHNIGVQYLNEYSAVVEW